MRFNFTIFFLCIILYACNQAKDRGALIPMETMKVVVWQLMKVDELYTRKSIADSTWKSDKKNVQFYHQIFELNKIDKAQFYKQMDNMKMHPNQFKELMDSVNELSKREKNSIIQPAKKLQMTKQF